MNIQVNSDHTIVMDPDLRHFIEHEGSRLLCRFSKSLTRIEVYLSDIDNKKKGQADKRCLVEVHPAGAQPLTVSAKAANIPYAVDEALRKMQRSLTTFFGRRRTSGGSFAMHRFSPSERQRAHHRQPTHRDAD
jgi:ribosome-associated translation inhibitor RaiA